MTQHSELKSTRTITSTGYHGEYVTVQEANKWHKETGGKFELPVSGDKTTRKAHRIEYRCTS